MQYITAYNNSNDDDDDTRGISKVTLIIIKKEDSCIRDGKYTRTKSTLGYKEFKFSSQSFHIQQIRHFFFQEISIYVINISVSGTYRTAMNDREAYRPNREEEH